jgi:large subunit ribosomal protein L18
MKLSKKKILAQKRRWRIRKKINGSADRPRVAVRFTNKNIHAQCVDDEQGHTVLGLATTHADFKDLLPNVSGAEKLGSALGEQIKAKGYSTIVFDRSGRKYHGCVKAFADAIRGKGIKF